MLHARDVLGSIPINDESLIVKIIPESEVVTSAKRFFNNHLNLHSILTVDVKSYFEIIEKTNAMTADEWVALYRQIGISINPFNLPIQYTEKYAYAGYLKSFDAYVDSDYVFI